MKSTLYHLHTLTGLHVGIGQGTGVIDQPIARERATNLPQVPGSGIKGVLRDELSESIKDSDDHLALFGPEPGDNDSEFAGAIAVGDARLLALPIRSWNGTLAWTSCPMILHRYQRDLKTEIDIPTPENNETGLHADVTSLLDSNGKVFLEDLDINASPGAEQWAAHIAKQIFSDDDDWQQIFKQRFVILPDSVFDFLAETATEIRARIRIEESTRTVKQGALWYEEYLPAESLLWGIVASDRSRKPQHNKTAAEMLALLPKEERLQIGGNATVGAGQTRWILSGDE